MPKHYKQMMDELINKMDEDAPTNSVAGGGVDLNPTGATTNEKKNIIHSTAAIDVNTKLAIINFNAHVSQYDYGNIHNHDPLRPRRLLLHRSEIRRLYGQVKEQGLTLIPIKIYLKGGIIKLELAL